MDSISGAGFATPLSRLAAGCTAVGLDLCNNMSLKRGICSRNHNGSFSGSNREKKFFLFTEKQMKVEMSIRCFGSVIGHNADPDIYLDAAQIFFTFHQIFL
jgi:hypothetical protein